MAVIRLSPGVYQDSKTGKRVNAITEAEAVKKLAAQTKKPTPQTPANNSAADQAAAAEKAAADKAAEDARLAAAGSAGGKDIAPGADNKTQDALTNEADVAAYETKQNVNSLNADTVGPLGSSTTDIDANGNVVQTNKLSDNQQAILSGGEGLTKMGQDLAKDQLEGYKPLTMGEDVTSDRARIEDEVFSRLTRNTDRDYQNEKKQLEQTLYNRGISLDPSDPQYKSNMDALNERYDTQKSNARAYATELGGQELTRSYGITKSTHDAGLTDAQSLENMGTGLMMPQTPGYNGTSTDLSNPTDLDLAFKEFAAKNKLNDAQIAELRRRNSGGSTTESAFATS